MTLGMPTFGDDFGLLNFANEKAEETEYELLASTSSVEALLLFPFTTEFLSSSVGLDKSKFWLSSSHLL